MSLPDRLTAFPLEQEILRKALDHPDGLTYELASYKMAVAFRQRLYQARRLLAKEGITKYDRLAIFLPKNTRVITIRLVKPTGILRDSTGNEIPVVLPPTKEERAAASMALTLEETAGIDLSILGDEND